MYFIFLGQKVQIWLTRQCKHFTLFNLLGKWRASGKSSYLLCFITSFHRFVALLTRFLVVSSAPSFNRINMWYSIQGPPGPPGPPGEKVCNIYIFYDHSVLQHNTTQEPWSCHIIIVRTFHNSPSYPSPKSRCYSTSRRNFALIHLLN